MNKKPLIGFKWISQLDYNNGNPKILLTELRPSGFGAFTFLTKNDFLEANGFSNLCIGWGVEDIIFSDRLKKGYMRIPQNLGHLQHPRRINLNPNDTAINRDIYYRNKKHKFIIENEDGYKQTIFDEISNDKNENYTIIKVNNITVVEGYKYINELKRHKI